MGKQSICGLCYLVLSSLERIYPSLPDVSNHTRIFAFSATHAVECEPSHVHVYSPNALKDYKLWLSKIGVYLCGLTKRHRWLAAVFCCPYGRSPRQRSVFWISQSELPVWVLAQCDGHQEVDDLVTTHCAWNYSCHLPFPRKVKGIWQTRRLEQVLPGALRASK